MRIVVYGGSVWEAAAMYTVAMAYLAVERLRPMSRHISFALSQWRRLSLDRTRDDDLAQDLMDCGLVACTATDTYDAAPRVPCSILNEWSESPFFWYGR